MKITKYTFFSDSIPNKPLAILTKREDIGFKEGNIEIIDNEHAPLLITMAYENCNNIKGLEVVMEDRVMPSNRMFFQEYCKEKGINPYSYDEKLQLSEGRSLTDDYYVKVETSYEID